MCVYIYIYKYIRMHPPTFSHTHAHTKLTLQKKETSAMCLKKSSRRVNFMISSSSVCDFAPTCCRCSHTKTNNY